MGFRGRSGAVSWRDSIGSMNPLCLLGLTLCPQRLASVDCINQTSLPLALAIREHQQIIKGQGSIFTTLNLLCKASLQCMHASTEGLSSDDWLSPAGSGNCSHLHTPSLSVQIWLPTLPSLLVLECYTIPCWFPLILLMPYKYSFVKFSSTVPFKGVNLFLARALTNTVICTRNGSRKHILKLGF